MFLGYNYNNDSTDFVKDLMFGVPRGLVFNTFGTKDMSPAKWTKNESGYECVCRTVGINSEDVNVTLKNDCILVSGESEIEGVKYNTRYELPISKDIISNVVKVRYRSLNGLTFIYLDVVHNNNKISVERF